MFWRALVTLLYIYLSLSAKEKFNIIGSKANQIQLLHGTFWQTSGTDCKRNLIFFFFFAVMTILFYLQVRNYMEKLEQKAWHSLTSGTIIWTLPLSQIRNTINKLTCHYCCSDQTLPTIWRWQQHHPSPQLLHEFLHQLQSSQVWNLFTSIYFTGIIFLNYFLKVTNSQHSIFMFFRTVFK